jgi:hypothetical protein
VVKRYGDTILVVIGEGDTETAFIEYPSTEMPEPAAMQAALHLGYQNGDTIHLAAESLDVMLLSR